MILRVAAVLLGLLAVLIPGSLQQQQQQQKCMTPTRKQGLCVSIYDCPSMLAFFGDRILSWEERDFLRLSVCTGATSGRQPFVCCPDKGRPAVPPGQPVTTHPPPVISSTVAPVDVEVTMRGEVAGGVLPNPRKNECGISIGMRIYGGEDADIDEFPWLALLKYAKPNDLFGFHCGGVLINDRYVLTASHCVNGKDIPTTWNLVEVRLGEWDTSTDQDCEGLGVDADCSPDPIDVVIENKLPHPQYNPQSLEQYNDIALLRLASHVSYTDFIKPICLPRAVELREKNIVGLKMQVAGWGRTATARYSAVKQKVGVDGVDLARCNQVYQKEGVTLLDGQLCAGGVTGKDSCQGDSGGPLMGVGTSGNVQFWYLAGLVSFGPTPCGQEGWPGVYTKVAKYVDWVENSLQP